MAETLEFIDPATEQPWTARLRYEGDSWGLDMKLVHEGDPVLEFYDRRYAERFASQNGGNLWGQFVSSYYLTTLQEDVDRLMAGGLNLHGGVTGWSLSGPAFTQVIEWALTDPPHGRQAL